MVNNCYRQNCQVSWLPPRMKRNTKMLGTSPIPQDGALHPSAWFEWQREKWCQSCSHAHPHSAYLPDIWRSDWYSLDQGLELMEGLHIPCSKRWQGRQGKASGLGQRVVLSLWPGTIDKLEQLGLEWGCPRSVATLGCRWNLPKGSSKWLTLWAEEKTRKVNPKREGKPLPEQRPGSLQSKYHMAKELEGA